MKAMCCLLTILGSVLASSLLYAQPIEFELGPAEPNPFDTTGTTVHFSVERGCYIEIIITNGSDTLRTLVSENLTAGNHFRFWDARDDENELLSYGYYLGFMTAYDDPVWYSPPLQLHLQPTEAVKTASYPPHFFLGQCYPNPFNPTTTIEYGLSTPGDITLSVYNIQGQLVEVIQDGFMPAGQRTATWSPQDLSSGVYLVELCAGANRDVMKVSYVK